MKIILYILLITFSLSLYGMSKEEQFINAIKTNDLNAAASLIKNIDVNKPINNVTPLTQAITQINPKIVQLLIQYGADVNKKDQTIKMFPLELAVMIANFEIAKILVDAKADVNEKNQEGIPFLYKAAMEGSGDIVQLLIKNGAIINQTLPKETFNILALKFIDNFKKSNLISSDAAQQMQTAIQNALIIPQEIKQANQLLLRASEEKNIEKIDRALAQGALVNVQDKNGYTALIFSVINIFPEAVQLLVDKGANVNIQDKQGWTPLMYILTSAIIESPKIINVIKILLNNNADVITIKNNRGQTAWDMAQNALPQIKSILSTALSNQQQALFNKNIIDLVNTLDTLRSQLTIK